MAYDRMRSFNKHVINPLTRKFAGFAHSPFALIRHIGRRSGKAYETPIIVEPLKDSFVIALTYGPEVDWYRNALAAGQCTLLWHGNVYTLNKPEPVDAEKALLAFPPLLRLLRARNTKDFVTVNPRNNPSPKRKESSMSELQILMTGLVMGESPRWHDDRLWLSDMGTREVIAVDLKGKSEIVARVPTGLTGIGFLPDGHLLIDTMFDGRILRLEPDGSLVTHADLTSLAHHPWSDMVVDGRGNSYVGNLGFNFPAGEEFAPGILVLVTPDGSAWQVAGGLAFPNGIAVTPDNSTLIVAESYGTRLTAFDISTHGSLSNRRVWADLPGAHPDGICVDAEGSVWYGDVPAKRCLRVREGGEVLQTIDLDRGCFACTLGGVNRRTLFLMAAEWSNVSNMLSGETRTGQVLTVEAPAPGAGWP